MAKNLILNIIENKPECIRKNKRNFQKCADDFFEMWEHVTRCRIVVFLTRKLDFFEIMHMT